MLCHWGSIRKFYHGYITVFRVFTLSQLCELLSSHKMHINLNSCYPKGHTDWFSTRIQPSIVNIYLIRFNDISIFGTKLIDNVLFNLFFGLFDHFLFLCCTVDTRFICSSYTWTLITMTFGFVLLCIITIIFILAKLHSLWIYVLVNSIESCVGCWWRCVTPGLIRLRWRSMMPSTWTFIYLT